MSWVVSKKKADFVGKRSFSRPDTTRPDRKHLVGLLPSDPGLLLPEGAHLIGDPALPALPTLPALRAGRPASPVPALGHVTSSYHSAALGRTFALGLIRSGRDRIGQKLYAPLDDRIVPVTVVSPVFYDPEGARRDG
jgi:sarcosine oxidase subunit alpha